MDPTPIRDAEVNIQTIAQLSTQADYKGKVEQFYDKWAENYDQDVEIANYTAPAACADELAKRVKDKNSALIVDCAAGTGRVGVELAKRGFKNIDAVDISQKSLDVSASKGVYRKLICDSLGKNKLKGVEDGCYDALSCIGALCASHLNEDTFEEWKRIVKKGGVMVFTFGKSAFEPQEQRELKNRMRAAIQDLIDGAEWEILERKDVDYLLGHSAEMYTVRRL